MTDGDVPEALARILEDVEERLGGDVNDELLAAAATAVGTYGVTRDAPRSVLVGLVVLVVLRLRAIDGRLEAIEDLDPEERTDAMRELERKIDPELSGDER